MGVGDKNGTYWKARRKESVVGKILGVQCTCFFLPVQHEYPTSDSGTQFSFGVSLLPHCQPPLGETPSVCLEGVT